MHSIEINGRTLQYEKGESEFFNYTNFYEGFETITKRKWFKTKQITQPKCIFMILERWDDTRFSKEWWKAQIEFELFKIDAINKRKEELKKGELI